MKNDINLINIFPNSKVKSKNLAIFLFLALLPMVPEKEFLIDKRIMGGGKITMCWVVYKANHMHFFSLNSYKL